jgi:hypothetical protein
MRGRRCFDNAIAALRVVMPVAASLRLVTMIAAHLYQRKHFESSMKRGEWPSSLVCHPFPVSRTIARMMASLGTPISREMMLRSTPI